jgi:hypothetical protein
MPSERWWWLVAALVAGLLAAGASAWALPARSTYGAKAAVDEPHYLLTAISLAEDGDLDVDDELDAERWRAFHDSRLPQQAEPLPDGRRVSPHDPLQSVLLAGPYAWGGLTGARLAQAALNGLVALALVHLLVRRLEVSAPLAGAAAAMAGVSLPLVVYGHQLYPETAAALAVVVGVDAALGPPRRWRSLGVVLAVIALPWLSVKYVPTAAVLAGLHLWWRWRDGDRRGAGALVAVYALAAATYAWGHLAWYGGLTVYAAGDFFVDNGGQLSVLGTRPNPLGRTPRLVGLLVDRGFGIASWQPAWLALVPALGAALRRRGRADVLLAALVLTAWAGATWVAVTMHGWWAPGRQVVHVLPLAVALVVRWLPQAGRAARVVTAAAAALGVWTSLALLTAARDGALTLVVDFGALTHPWRDLWVRALPDQLARPPGTWPLTSLWAAVALALLVAGWRAARGQPSDQSSAVDRSSG